MCQIGAHPPKREGRRGHSRAAYIEGVSEPKKPRRPAAKELLPRRLRRETAAPETAVEEPARPGVVIRRATSRDLAPLLALRALMFTAMGASTEAVSANAWQANARRWLQVNLGNERVNITIAEVNGSAVACAIGEVVERPPSPGNPDGLVGMLGNVATFPEYRMTGLGQACVDAVMAWFREETAVTSVELFATAEGRRRYAAHGFADHPVAHLRVAIPRGDA